MKKLILILVGTIVILIGLKYISKPFTNEDSVLGRISNQLNANNKITLECQGLEPSDVDITWDTELSKSKTIIHEGQLIGKIGHEYGPNKFTVNINDKPILSFSHFKTNNWHYHNYDFSVLIKGDSISIHFSAIGPDYKDYNKKMKL